MHKNSVAAFVQSLAAIFRPPFDGLWLVVVLYYFWCYLVYPHSPILRGNLPDTDDYMYLTQVMDWLKGQGWYDNVQHRLDPSADGSGGVPIHFSRLAQIPMAAFILFFEFLGLGLKGSATLTAALYPSVLLAAFFLAMRWSAERVMPKAWAGVTAYIGLFATAMLSMFQAGHLDHHGLILLIVALALGCVFRMLQAPDAYRWGFAAGTVLALGLTIALEILPSLLILAGWIWLWAMSQGRRAARNGMAFGLALYVVSLLCLVLTRPPRDFLTPDILTYSIVYVFLTGGIAIGLVGLSVTAEAPPWARWLTGCGLAAVTGVLFLHRFPDLAKGPYGAIDPQLAKLILSEVTEAQSIVKVAGGSIFGVLMRVGGAFIAVVAALCFFRKAKDDQRWIWGLIIVFLGVFLLLALIYQYRFAGVMGLVSILPLAVLLQRGWGWIGQHSQGRQRVYAELALILLVGPLPAVIVPAVADGRSFNTGILLFPVNRARDFCDTYVLEQMLRSPSYFGDRPRLILSTMEMGPEILFRTAHKVLAAPYHMDVQGNIDADRFFETPYASEAEAIARRRHVDLIVLCRALPTIYTRVPEGVIAEGKTQDFAPHFAELLEANKAPKWLKPVPIKALGNFLVFEVLPLKPSVSETKRLQ